MLPDNCLRLTICDGREFHYSGEVEPCATRILSYGSELGLRRVAVFVDQSRDDGFRRTDRGSATSPDGLRFDVRGPLTPGLVRPVAVVMGQVLAAQVQVALAADQGPVQQLAAEGPDDAFADGVHSRRPRQSSDDPQTFGLEHLPERGGEQRIAIMNQEPQRAEAVIQVHGQVPGLLYRPCPGRVGGHSGQVHPSGAVLDEHQHVQPLEEDGFYY
jgi:hypothetical protein